MIARFMSFYKPGVTEVLDKIMDRTSFVCIHEPVPTEPEMRKAEPSEIESEPSESPLVDSIYETAPEL